MDIHGMLSQEMLQIFQPEQMMAKSGLQGKMEESFIPLNMFSMKQKLLKLFRLMQQYLCAHNFAKKLIKQIVHATKIHHVSLKVVECVFLHQKNLIVNLPRGHGVNRN